MLSMNSFFVNFWSFSNYVLEPSSLTEWVSKAGNKALCQSGGLAAQGLHY